MPASYVDRLIDVGDYFPDAFYNMVETNILLKWVGAREIVVPIIRRPPNHSPAHVTSAGNREKGDLHLKVTRLDVFS